jgi:hypothetical protein
MKPISAIKYLRDFKLKPPELTIALFIFERMEHAGTVDPAIREVDLNGNETVSGTGLSDKTMRKYRKSLFKKGVFLKLSKGKQTTRFGLPKGVTLGKAPEEPAKAAAVVEVTAEEQIAARIAEITECTPEQSFVDEAVQITGGRAELLLDYLRRLPVRGKISNDHLLRKIRLYAQMAGIPKASDISRQYPPSRG